MELTSTDKFFFVTGRIIAFISFLSSLCVLREAWADWRERKERNTLVHRLQISLQVSLLIHMASLALGTTPAPRGEGWGSIGNVHSCTAQGMLTLFAVSSGMLWDMCISLAHHLTVHHGWDESKLSKIEKYFHAVIWPFAVSVAIGPLLRDNYNLGDHHCWLEPKRMCADGSTGTECPVVRGEPFIIARVILLVEIFLHLTFSLYVVIRIYRFASRAIEEDHVKRLVAIKGVLYASAVLVIQGPLVVVMTLRIVVDFSAPILIQFLTISLSFVGLLNLLVFMINRRQMQSRYGRFVRELIDGAAFYCCQCRWFPALFAEPLPATWEDGSEKKQGDSQLTSSMDDI